MKTRSRSSLIMFMVFAAMAGIAYGAPPLPNVVDSDGRANTAMGSGALFDISQASAIPLLVLQRS
jgi:hypothetical protein